MDVSNTTADYQDLPAYIVTSNSLFLVLLYRYGLGFLFLFGFTGNLASLATFMRPTLRSTSIGLLFFILALSDIMFLGVSIFDFVEVGLTQRPIFLANYDNFCRFRGFSQGFLQFSSAWILVLIGIDRWVRTRFSFKTNQWCTRRNAIIGVILIIIIGTGLHSHMLSDQLFGGFLPGIATVACGPISHFIPYLPFYFTLWPFIQVFLVCLIPVLLMLVTSIDIYHVIRKTKNRVQQIGINQPQQLRRDRLQRQMLLLMIASIMLFFSTTLPVNIRRIVAAFDVYSGVATNLDQIIDDTSILTILLTFNYTVNFYIHCLASKLFREEFLQYIKIIHRLSRQAVGINNSGITRTVMSTGINTITRLDHPRNQPQTLIPSTTNK